MASADPLAIIRRARDLVSFLEDEFARRLLADPDSALAELGITIVERTGSGDCDLDASFDRRNRIITVAADASNSRRRFSLLHEFGHDRINSNDGGDVADWLYTLGKRANEVEERVCDAFAAEIMFSGVDEKMRAKFSAADVIRLYENTPASREACCVYAAQHLSEPGIVLLAYDGTVLFSSQHSLQFRVARGVAQPADSALSRASTSPDGYARAHLERLQLRTMRSFTELDGDARRTNDGYVFAVLRESPPETDQTGKPIQRSWYCGTCGDDITDEDWCNECRQRICPDCGCKCIAKPNKACERRCSSCGVTAAPALEECEICGAELG